MSESVADSPTIVVTDYLRRLAAPLEAKTDPELLALYSARQDADAFALLVRRHGPMVLAVCRRAIGNTPDADDAFQATFLALARNPRRVRECVPGWLHRVAVRTSRRALRRTDRPPLGAERADEMDSFATVEWRDVRRLLDEELSRLPAKLRVPLVLCYLDGRTRDEAARQLSWSLRTLHRRLDEGRNRLRERLNRRGLGPALLAGAILAADDLRAEVPPALARDAAQLGTRDTIVPASIRTLVPNLSWSGGLTMKVMISALILVSGIVLVLGSRQPAGADPIPKPKEPELPALLARAPAAKKVPPSDAVAGKVKEAQEKAIKYLKSQQKETKVGANWEGEFVAFVQKGGPTALALLALLESGLKPEDPAVASGLKYLRGIKSEQTYVVSLQMQVYCKANQKDDADRIKRNVEWLEDTAIRNAGKFQGWNYTTNTGDRSDNSNTRYALSGLYAAHRAGFKVKKEGFWEEVRDYYMRTQTRDGGWTYTAQNTPPTTHTMTLSGVLGLTQVKEVLGKEDEDAQKARQAGLEWIADNFTLKTPQHVYYNLDLIAAVGRATDKKDLGHRDRKREWYKEGAEWLLKDQSPDGAWQIKSGTDAFPVISTSFALRFLASRPED